MSQPLTLARRIAGRSIAAELDDKGFCVIEGILCAETVGRLNECLGAAVRRLGEQGVSTHSARIDPNPHSIRIYDLPEQAAMFRDLGTLPEIVAAVEILLDGPVLISALSANNALPGARPMNIHSDQALVLPAPWHHRYTLNVIWCLDDIDEANGATCYLPGSHHITDLHDLPEDAAAAMQSLRAPAGSAIFMDGRLWHASGSNTSIDRERAMLFAYYTRNFIRRQTNWHEVLAAQTIAGLDTRERELFGFGAIANTHGLELVLRT